MYAKVAQNHETKEGKVKNDLIYIILHTFEYKGKKLILITKFSSKKVITTNDFLNK